jgi:hypothetical protein
MLRDFVGTLMREAVVSDPPLWYSSKLKLGGAQLLASPPRGDLSSYSAGIFKQSMGARNK